MFTDYDEIKSETLKPISAIWVKTRNKSLWAWWEDEHIKCLLGIFLRSQKCKSQAIIFFMHCELLQLGMETFKRSTNQFSPLISKVGLVLRIGTKPLSHLPAGVLLLCQLEFSGSPRLESGSFMFSSSTILLSVTHVLICTVKFWTSTPVPSKPDACYDEEDKDWKTRSCDSTSNLRVIQKCEP